MTTRAGSLRTEGGELMGTSASQKSDVRSDEEKAQMSDDIKGRGTDDKCQPKVRCQIR